MLKLGYLKQWNTKKSYGLNDVINMEINVYNHLFSKFASCPFKRPDVCVK